MAGLSADKQHRDESSAHLFLTMGVLALQVGDTESAQLWLSYGERWAGNPDLSEAIAGIAKRLASKEKARAKREAKPKDPPLLRSCVKLLEERLGRPLEVWTEIAKLRALLRRWEAKAESIELQLKYAVMRENINDKFFVRNVIDAAGKAMAQSGRKATGAVKEWNGHEP